MEYRNDPLGCWLGGADSAAITRCCACFTAAPFCSVVHHKLVAGEDGFRRDQWLVGCRLRQAASLRQPLHCWACALPGAARAGDVQGTGALPRLPRLHWRYLRLTASAVRRNTPQRPWAHLRGPARHAVPAARRVPGSRRAAAAPPRCRQRFGPCRCCARARPPGQEAGNAAALCPRDAAAPAHAARGGAAAGGVVCAGPCPSSGGSAWQHARL